MYNNKLLKQYWIDHDTYIRLKKLIIRLFQKINCDPKKLSVQNFLYTPYLMIRLKQKINV